MIIDKPNKDIFGFFYLRYLIISTLCILYQSLILFIVPSRKVI
nr:MAG TPA: hypothetical protein [Caudoviricetes sp.]